MMRYVKDTVSGIFDRADPTVKARQDIALHAALFAASIWAISRWGHKLAV